MARVRALLRSHDPSVARLERADVHHHETLDELRSAIDTLGLRARYRDRSNIGVVDDVDLVITVGGDGTLLSASHAIGTIPVFGVNSAPMDSVGFLCSARRGQVLSRLRAVVRGALATTNLARMRVVVEGQPVHTRVLNDVLYAHRNPAMTARYILAFRRAVEEHKSSGIWISTAAGSTAAVRSAGGRVLSPRSKLLEFVVREPYDPTGRGPTWQRGLVRPHESLEIWNKMRQAALFLDGPRTIVPLEIGQRVRFELSPEPLSVIGFARNTSARPAAPAG
jgi:NAD+ kinase